MRNTYNRLLPRSIVLFSILLMSACNSKSDLERPVNKSVTSTLVKQNNCANEQGKLLVFSKTSGFRHTSIEQGIAAIKELGCEYGLAVDASEDGKTFTANNLEQYATVLFLNTTQDILNTQQKVAFKSYIQGGGGFLGVHAATDTEYQWPWYNKLVGAYFNGHPKQQTGKLTVKDLAHSSTELLPNTYSKFDEWYNFKDINEDINVLIEIDETSYQGGTNGKHHPISWYHNFDGGRAFYTAMGHTEASYEDKDFLNHIVGALKYTTDLPLKSFKDMPDETRFVRDILDDNLYEPIELDEVPNQGILFIERRGDIKFYDFQTEEVKLIAHKDVFSEDEDGLLGLAVDPNYEENNWIYLFYSVPGEEHIQHISRFDLVNKQLDTTSEKVLLTIPVNRGCCHSGGSIKFGPDGYLYIGVGDNTNPFKSDGYAPIDERPGQTQFDAQKSAANTNDFRGKILRIKPEDNGRYTIPAGNLFVEGGTKTKPEVYVMGVRNPFRFIIDSENDYLYWGDIGPDAGKGDLKRGPKGMGEINQAKSAGNWGWPYTRGNNQRYNDYNFVTKKSGEKFDPNNLTNDSPNNTGLTKLPPAQESMIWYSYDASKEFPWLGEGGVNPMVGPIFHKKSYGEATATFPQYFENKLFVYEWMRDWIYVVTLDNDKNYVKAEQFLPSEKFSKPIDMLFASDGHLYILEYGAKWFKQNKDARLNRISYVSGNRKPIAKIKVDKISGAAPLAVNISGKGSLDYDKDKLTYQWRINGKLLNSSTEDIRFTFENNGEHIVELTVTDEAGLQGNTNLNIVVGNSEPEITISISPTSTEYTHNSKISYEVIVTDTQDGASTDSSISAEDIKISLNYVAAHEFTDKSQMGHQENINHIGKKLIEGSDCRACHGVSEKVNGPSYQSIASKYSIKDINYLVKKVIEGGAGVWGESPMSAHPQLNTKDVTSMVEYIFSLDPNSEKNKGLPLKGELTFNKHPVNERGGKYILKATYQDKGINNNKSTRLTTTERVIFTSRK